MVSLRIAGVIFSATTASSHGNVNFDADMIIGDVEHTRRVLPERANVECKAIPRPQLVMNGDKG